MKTLSTIFALVLVGSMNIVSAQSEQNTNSKVHKNISDYNPERPMVVDAYQPPYIISDKKLATYFKSGSIPSSFPKYNYDWTKEENVKLVKQWFSDENNLNLLSEEGKAKLEEVKAKKNIK